MEDLEHIGLGPEKTVEVCTKICTVHMHINTHIGLGAEMSLISHVTIVLIYVNVVFIDRLYSSSDISTKLPRHHQSPPALCVVSCTVCHYHRTGTKMYSGLLTLNPAWPRPPPNCSSSTGSEGRNTRNTALLPEMGSSRTPATSPRPERWARISQESR